MHSILQIQAGKGGKKKEKEKKGKHLLTLDSRQVKTLKGANHIKSPHSQALIFSRDLLM